MLSAQAKSPRLFFKPGAITKCLQGGAAAALEEYTLLLDPATPQQQRETALFMSGKALQQLGRIPEARARLTQYLREYPQGRFAASCNTLLHLLQDTP